MISYLRGFLVFRMGMGWSCGISSANMPLPMKLPNLFPSHSHSHSHPPSHSPELRNKNSHTKPPNILIPFPISSSEASYSLHFASWLANFSEADFQHRTGISHSDETAQGDGDGGGRMGTWGWGRVLIWEGKDGGYGEFRVHLWGKFLNGWIMGGYDGFDMDLSMDLWGTSESRWSLQHCDANKNRREWKLFWIFSDSSCNYDGW